MHGRKNIKLLVFMLSHTFRRKYLQQKGHPFRNNVEFLRPEDSVLPGHDAVSISDRLLAFRGEVLSSNSRVDRSYYEATILSRNVGIRMRSDVASSLKNIIPATPLQNLRNSSPSPPVLLKRP